MPDPTAIRVEFAGEWFDPDPDRSFTIGREGDLAVDDNPYLHRSFLEIAQRDGLWWLTNVGTRLSATLSSAGGAVDAHRRATGWVTGVRSVNTSAAEHVKQILRRDWIVSFAK